MKLTEEEQKAIVSNHIEKSKITLREAKGNIEMEFWNSAANRLYYACYYMLCALLIKNGYSARTHSGVISLLGQYFINTELLPKELGRAYTQLFELRQSGDYDDWKIIDESEVHALLKPAEKFIEAIERLIQSD